MFSYKKFAYSVNINISLIVALLEPILSAVPLLEFIIIIIFYNVFIVQFPQYEVVTVLIGTSFEGELYKI